MPDVSASQDPAVIARGEYLVYGPAHCVECHASSFEEFQKVARHEQVPLQAGLHLPLPRWARTDIPQGGVNIVQ